VRLAIRRARLAQSPTQAAKPAPSAKKTTASGAGDSTAKAKPKIAGPVWPVDSPAPLPGALLPTKRIVAFYGNPLAKRMGILGELAPDDMLTKLDREVSAWNAADPATPVQPALHLIAVVASDSPGKSGKYRTRMDSALIEKVYGWAQKKNAILFLDVQVGQGTLQEELPRLRTFLKRPDVHLGIDPEFSMKGAHVPGTKIGTFDAKDVNYASSMLQDIVTEEHVPPKVLVIHRFTRDMLTGYKRIKLDPRVQIVVNMDGWVRRRSSANRIGRTCSSTRSSTRASSCFTRTTRKRATSSCRRPPCSRSILGRSTSSTSDRAPRDHSATMIVGSWRTGKFTELAMKHPACADSCSSRAFSRSVPFATVTRGRRSTSVKRILPSCSSITPCASSPYATTTTPARAQSAR